MLNCDHERRSPCRTGKRNEAKRSLGNWTMTLDRRSKRSSLSRRAQAATLSPTLQSGADERLAEELSTHRGPLGPKPVCVQRIRSYRLHLYHVNEVLNGSLVFLLILNKQFYSSPWHELENEESSETGQFFR